MIMVARALALVPKGGFPLTKSSEMIGLAKCERARGVLATDPRGQGPLMAYIPAFIAADLNDRNGPTRLFVVRARVPLPVREIRSLSRRRLQR